MSDQTIIGVCQTDATGSYRSLTSLGDSGNETVSSRSVWVGINDNASGQFGSAAYNATLQFGGNVTSQSLGMYIGVDGGNGTAYVNGSQVAQAANGTYQSSTGNGSISGHSYTAQYRWDGTIQEVIWYPLDQSSPTNNRPAIETNINDFFSIY